MYRAKVFNNFDDLASYLNDNSGVSLIASNERQNLKVSTLLSGEETPEVKMEVKPEIKKTTTKKKTITKKKKGK